ncbi:aldehyde ferredoxin oxidoreductase family protein [[Eubacterium] cellulosolvens]
MNNWKAQILRINLSNKGISQEEFTEEDAKKYLGGRGLAAKILYDELKPQIDPLGPENKLVYTAGPFAGSGFLLNSRWLVAGKSPLTGIWGEATCGGSFAAQLKKAGYIAVVVEGASDTPVYINISDDKAEVRDASKLWGKMTLETELGIAQELGLERREDNPAVICIGPAGERLVKFAAVMHTAHRAAGRTGLGAVMGSKRLKALAVQGTGKVSVAKPERLREMVKEVASECVTNENMVNFTKHGQAGFVLSLNELGMLPTKNFQKGTFEHYEAISGQRMSETILKRKSTCSECPVACKRDVEVTEGPYAPIDPRYGGPEYENVASLGSLLLISDLAAISKENQLCNEYGLDTISTGNIIAWVMECYDRGIITKEDIDGIDAKWGNIDAALELITKIAERDGVGDLLAEGIKKASRKIGKGSERYAVEVKGLEIPMHEPRAKKGLGLSYATSVRGGCHMQAFHDSDFEGGNAAPEIGITKALDRHDTSPDKVKIIKLSQDWVAVTNSLLLCTSPGWFGFNYTRPAFVTEALNVITGWNLTPNDLMTVGERANNLCRCFNTREGMTRKDDYLPPRFTEDALPDGPSKGHRIPTEELNSMLDNYYELRGWNKTTGNPTPEKLKELNLEFAIAYAIM